MKRCGLLVVLAGMLVVAGVAHAQGVDPRTADGQLQVCGGVASWQSVGYLEFEVKISTPDGNVQGPWMYRWGRREGVLRMSGPWVGGAKLEVVLDIASRTGGGWENGKQLVGKRLGEASNWALQRFGEDILWLTFPLEWSNSGVEVFPQPKITESAGKSYQATEVKTSRGTWKVWLDDTTGRVVKSVLAAEGATPLTVLWSDWKDVNGVLFSQHRQIVETGESVDVTVVRSLGQSPADAF